MSPKQAETLASELRAAGSARNWAPLIVYSVASGTVALIVGAVVSLAATESHRLVLWAVTTAGMAMVAGIAHECRGYYRLSSSGASACTTFANFLIRRVTTAVTKVTSDAPPAPIDKI
jgi:hypothetical protein